MHFNPILLVQADSLEEAKEIAEYFCKTESREHSYFDYGGIVSDEETEWNKPLNEVKDKLPKVNYLEKAKLMVRKAEEFLHKENYGMTGYYYGKAGELYSQSFSTEYPIFNIKCYDYSQDYGEGWYAIEADFLY